jgi:hypothetical protein
LRILIGLTTASDGCRWPWGCWSRRHLKRREN